MRSASSITDNEVLFAATFLRVGTGTVGAWFLLSAHAFATPLAEAARKLETPPGELRRAPHRGRSIASFEYEGGVYVRTRDLQKIRDWSGA